MLDWNERTHAPHAGMLALHRAALALRRTDPVLSAGAGDLQVARHGEMIVVIRSVGAARRTLVWNLGREPRELTVARGTVLLASSDGAVRAGTIAARCAAVLAA